MSNEGVRNIHQFLICASCSQVRVLIWIVLCTAIPDLGQGQTVDGDGWLTGTCVGRWTMGWA
eukprot:7169452-Lingulodinium_polyedra.AAC.1